VVTSDSSTSCRPVHRRAAIVASHQSARRDSSCTRPAIAGSGTSIDRYAGDMTTTALRLPVFPVRSSSAAPTSVPREASPFLIDSHGRRAVDLRVSLTDKCNLRCSYCMPAEGLDWLPGQELLTDDEL
jgi:cyclic pyranopterin phosphate synthase